MVKNTIYALLVCFLVTFGYSQEEEQIAVDYIKEEVYKVVGADTLKLQIYNPSNFDINKTHPAIVFYFGGGWKGGDINQFKPQAMHFASRGMVAVLVDYRVEKRHKTTPFEAVKDAKTAIRFLRKNAETYGVDINKIVVSGGSAGGHLAAATSLISKFNEDTDDLSISTKANALVLYNPVIDNSEAGYGYERIGKEYMHFSPLHNITKGAPPTIFFLGDKDKHIPVSTAYTYKEKMENVGSRCDVFIYNDQPHGFFNKGRQKEDKYLEETTKQADLFLQSVGILTAQKQ